MNALNSDQSDTYEQLYLESPDDPGELLVASGRSHRLGTLDPAVSRWTSLLGRVLIGFRVVRSTLATTRSTATVRLVAVTKPR